MNQHDFWRLLCAYATGLLCATSPVRVWLHVYITSKRILRLVVLGRLSGFRLRDRKIPRLGHRPLRASCASWLIPWSSSASTLRHYLDAG